MAPNNVTVLRASIIITPARLAIVDVIEATPRFISMWNTGRSLCPMHDSKDVAGARDILIPNAHMSIAPVAAIHGRWPGFSS
jgi:hypothetical protein